MYKHIFLRRTFLKGLGGTVGGSLLSILSPLGRFPLFAENSPCPKVAGKKIRWVVPHSSGGGYDTISRIIAPFYKRALGTEIFVENITGAGGIVGAKTISEAKPDGLTIGILNGSGLMALALAGDKNAPNPEKDFTILGRVARSRHVWLTGKHSPFQTIEDVLKEAEKRPMVFGIRDVGSVNFISITITSNFLGINSEVIAGYSGSRQGTLAALRGDVDIVSYNFESILAQIENGDVRPLLQISDEQISSHSSLVSVPLLGGETGLAALRAAELGRDKKEAIKGAKALSKLIGAGRLIVAPLGLDKDLSACLERELIETLNAQDFKAAAAKANRSLDIARADTAKSDLKVVTQTMNKFAPILQEAIKKARR